MFGMRHKLFAAIPACAILLSQAADAQLVLPPPPAAPSPPTQPIALPPPPAAAPPAAVATPALPPAAAPPPVLQRPAPAPVAQAAATEQSLSELVRRAILDNLPREFTGDSNWGNKREVASGLKFNTDGGRLRVEKRTKQVNDGLWLQYIVALVDPQQQLRVRVADLRPAGPGRVGFTLYLSARLNGELRYERWRRGIKMLNFKVDAQSTVEAALACEVGFRLAPGAWLGDVVIEPRVNSVRLTLVDVDLARVSRIDGRLAEEVGDQLRHTLDKQLSSREAEITQKLNAAIAAQSGKLRFPSERLLSFGKGAAQSMVNVLATPKATATPSAATVPSAAVPGTLIDR